MFRLVQEEGLFEPRRLDDIATACSRGGWIVESRVRSGKEKENYYFSITLSPLIWKFFRLRVFQRYRK